MIEVYFDGASAGNPGPSGAGIYIYGNGHTERYSIPLENMNNHEAEFSAFIIALEICLEKGYKSVSFRTDSQLVSRAVEKNFVKNPAFRPYLDKAEKLIAQFDLFFIKWIASSENKTADLLAKNAIKKRKGAQK